MILAKGQQLEVSFGDTWQQLSEVWVPGLMWLGQATGLIVRSCRVSPWMPGCIQTILGIAGYVVTWPISLAHLSLGPTGISERGQGRQGH